MSWVLIYLKQKNKLIFSFASIINDEMFKSLLLEYMHYKNLNVLRHFSSLWHHESLSKPQFGPNSCLRVPWEMRYWQPQSYIHYATEAKHIDLLIKFWQYWYTETGWELQNLRTQKIANNSSDGFESVMFRLASGLTFDIKASGVFCSLYLRPAFPFSMFIGSPRISHGEAYHQVNKQYR